MKALGLVSLTLLLSVSSVAQRFQTFLTRANATPDSLRSAVVDSFMNTVASFPFIDNDTTAVFLFRGSASSVTVPGDANAWSISGYPMALLPATNLWYWTQRFESDARLDYKFVLNGSTWFLDPRNPRTVSGGFGPNSELSMPRYVAHREFQYYAAIPHGTLIDTALYSVNLAAPESVTVYLPPSYQTTTDSFPVILYHDGPDCIHLGQANNVIDYLINARTIRPIIAVFIPPDAANRSLEYAGSLISQFTAFIVNEAMPYVDSRYRTMRNPLFRGTIGSSNGGNISLWLGMKYPNLFGNVAAQSSNIIASVDSGFRYGARLPLRLYLDLGTYDIPFLIPLVRTFVPVLQSKGYFYQYREYHEGHSWGNWRAHQGDALAMFFALPDEVRNTTPPAREFSLSQNFPNPFNPSTTIIFSLDRPRTVSLKLFDFLGRELRTIVSGSLTAGTHRVVLAVHDLPSGVYIYRLQAGERSDSKTLVIAR